MKMYESTFELVELFHLFRWRGKKEKVVIGLGNDDGGKFNFRVGIREKRMKRGTILSSFEFDTYCQFL